MSSIPDVETLAGESAALVVSEKVERRRAGAKRVGPAVVTVEEERDPELEAAIRAVSRGRARPGPPAPSR